MPFAPNHSVVQHFQLPFDESELQAWATKQRERLADGVTFATLFCTEEAIPVAAEIIEIVRIYAQVPSVIGCSGVSLVADQHEWEGEAGYCVALYSLPNTRAAVYHLPDDVLLANDAGESIRQLIEADASAANAWMLFASSESLGSEAWLADWDQATGGKETVGGFASSDPRTQEVAFFADGKIYEAGAVALALLGEVTIEPVISQGCRPVGAPWTVTQAENNVIHEIGNRPILEVLRDTLEAMSHEEQKQARGNIFIGLVLDEYKADFATGDFLVRNLAAIDPKTGAVAIATPLRVGQNLQFQIRDAQTATRDLEEALEHRLFALGQRSVFGACLSDCIGRGSSLFGVPDHDTGVVRQALPEMPLIGCFFNGEFASIRGRTYLHGYTASLALFVSR